MGLNRFRDFFRKFQLNYLISMDSRLELFHFLLFMNAKTKITFPLYYRNEIESAIRSIKMNYNKQNVEWHEYKQLIVSNGSSNACIVDCLLGTSSPLFSLSDATNIRDQITDALFQFFHVGINVVVIQ